MQGTQITLTYPAATDIAPQGLEAFLNVNGYHGAAFTTIVDPARKGKKLAVEVASDRMDVDIVAIRDDVERLIKEFESELRADLNRRKEPKEA